MKIHPIRGYICINYVIEYDDKLLLLDSGCRCDVKVIKSFIEDTLLRPFSDLKTVLVSHAHPDHSGGAAYYKKLGIKVGGPKKSNEWYSGLSGFFTYLTDIALTYFVASKLNIEDFYQNVFFPRSIDFDFFLKDGESIPGFEDWEAIKCPGHTASDFSFFHSHTKKAYVADNLITTKRGIIPPYPIVFPQLYKKSLQKYIDLGVEEFLMAHYGRQKIKHEKLTEIILKVKETPRRHRTALPKLIFRFFKS